MAQDPGRKVSGPLYLKGGIQVFSSDGKPYEARKRITLCRCGASRNKPFCDGSHIKTGFDDGDAAVKELSKVKVLNWLKQHLQTAILLELSTMPPYLTAYWSITGNSEYAEKTKEFIMSVVREEMLHMAMACNILNAVGGSPVLNDLKLLPVYPCVLPGHSKIINAFVVHLDKCCPKSISNFMQIELPEGLAENKPHTDGWCTIGEFYDEIEMLLQHNLLDDSDFTGGRQTGSSFNPTGGKLYTVNSQADAIKALEEIIDQGEGHSGHLYNKDRQLTHYSKFSTILDLMRHEIWDFEKEVAPLHPDPHEDYFNEEAEALNKKFNILYSKLLDSLHASFNSNSPSLTQAVQIMFQLKEPAVQLMNIPCIGREGNCAPTFHYIPINERA